MMSLPDKLSKTSGNHLCTRNWQSFGGQFNSWVIAIKKSFCFNVPQFFTLGFCRMWYSCKLQPFLPLYPQLFWKDSYIMAPSLPTTIKTMSELFFSFPSTPNSSASYASVPSLLVMMHTHHRDLDLKSLFHRFIFNKMWQPNYN